MAGAQRVFAQDVGSASVVVWRRQDAATRTQYFEIGVNGMHVADVRVRSGEKVTGGVVGMDNGSFDQMAALAAGIGYVRDVVAAVAQQEGR